MTALAGRDRLRSLIDVVVASLDDCAQGEDIARRAYLSRFHFDRLLAAALGESPGAFRRRLLLERAAHELACGRSVLEAALDAGYSSAEAFARAFRRAYGLAPSRFAGDFRLRAPNGIHFHPPGGLLVPADNERRKQMDLIDRMLEHDLWHTRQLLDAGAALGGDALDQHVEASNEPPGAWFDNEPLSLRTMLERLIYSKEIWTAALAGRVMPQRGETSLDSLRDRFELSGTEFVTMVRDISDRGAWDTAFVDALCDPPETFTFGGMVAHVLTRSAHRRQVIVGVLRDLGADVSSGDPIEWERRAA